MKILRYKKLVLQIHGENIDYLLNSGWIMGAPFIPKEKINCRWNKGQTLNVSKLNINKNTHKKYKNQKL